MAKAMVAAVTPFRNGSLDREAASRLVEFARAMGFDGLFFGSSTGWSAALSRKQHMELMEFAASQGGVEVLAGISRNNVDETLEMGRFVSDLGIRRAVLVTPYYHRYSQASMFRYFSLISSSLDLDVYLYDNPALTGTSLSLETVRRLHEECSNVVGIKDSSGSVKRIAELAGLGISVFQGKDSVLLESIEAGAEGGICSTANFTNLTAVIVHGEKEEAREAQERVKRVVEVISKYEVPVIHNYLFRRIVLGEAEPSSYTVEPFQEIHPSPELEEVERECRSFFKRRRYAEV